MQIDDSQCQSIDWCWKLITVVIDFQCQLMNCHQLISISHLWIINILQSLSGFDGGLKIWNRCPQISCKSPISKMVRFLVVRPFRMSTVAFLTSFLASWTGLVLHQGKVGREGMVMAIDINRCWRWIGFVTYRLVIDWSKTIDINRFDWHRFLLIYRLTFRSSILINCLCLVGEGYRMTGITWEIIS